ncbi:MAG: DUF4922 domain-containing protein, partial [Muribaculaceae bacterium]|nr:DUF4922 domain-containing protein [Muribaculaceae bacterium]
TDSESIKKRACFLCASNRPQQQIAQNWLEGWELLLNPYPILPIHFTIVDCQHRRQDEIPLEMAVMAEKAPDLAIFYNGAKAGASAPDHRHCQAVLKTELPIIHLTEKHHLKEMPHIVSSTSFGLSLPFNFISAVITPDNEGMRNLYLMTRIKGIDRSSGQPDPDLVNAFFWIDSDGLLRIIVIPRRAHRPDMFYAQDETKMTVSPGALDMAGLLILPVENDYNRISPEIASRIYEEVAFSGNIPDSVFPTE